MDGVPARCLACGHVFEDDTLFGGPGSANITLEDNITACPKCGGQAVLGEGEFLYDAGSIEFIDGAPWTRDLVAELAAGLARVLQTEPDDVDAALAAEIPTDAARAVTAVTRGKSRAFKLAVVAALWKALNSDYGPAEHNIDVMLNAAREILRYVSEHGHLPGS